MAYYPDESRVAVIIEDDDDVRHLLEDILTQAGFDTIATSNGLDGIRAVRDCAPVITTLDVSMLGMDGFEVAKRIRQFSSTYLFMITARDDEIDALQGLEAGADDYIIKPFRPRELRARINAVMRRPRESKLTDSYVLWTDNQLEETRILMRADGDNPASAVASHATSAIATLDEERIAPSRRISVPVVEKDKAILKDILPIVEELDPLMEQPSHVWLEHNGLQLMPEMRLVKLGNSEIDLTRTEFDLLAALIESNRRVRSKADLALLLRGESYVTAYYVNEADKRAVETHISNLRRKLGDSITTPRWIETVRGVGYRLAASQIS